MFIRVQTEDFDFTDELAKLRLSNPRIGAVVSFLGLVRDLNDGNTIVKIELEHYPGMTEKVLASIVEQAEQQWDIFNVLLIHRIGLLLPLEQIVLVAVSSAHRSDAFFACEYIIDHLKIKAPFWKREYTKQATRWANTHHTDAEALVKWRIGK